MGPLPLCAENLTGSIPGKLSDNGALKAGLLADIQVAGHLDNAQVLIRINHCLNLLLLLCRRLLGRCLLRRKLLLSGLGRACRPRLLRLRASRLLPGKAGYGSPHHKYNKHNEDQSRQGKQQIPGVPSLVSPSSGFIQAGHIIFMLEHGASSSPHCKSRNLL